MEYSDWRDMVRVVKIRRIKSRLHQLGIEPGIWHRKRVPVTKHEWNVWKLFEVLESFQVDPRMGGGRSLEGHGKICGYRKGTENEYQSPNMNGMFGNCLKVLESFRVDPRVGGGMSLEGHGNVFFLIFFQ
ncbi:uncharacterized protein LOC124931814 isoform X2 [Impatiens glandulifera]|uniref:uncharacterized protein LOC124931814 isoform X2 n=1 Tax=Impatiens glandulifera TaxID=253017 RepID=UPI001FB05E78|nr:uncharacterized protein LOC124931814 isoform X2 [Impatiens glandulifera]